MDLLKKNSKDEQSKFGKARRELIFIVVIALISLSTYMINFLFIDRKNKRVELYFYNYRTHKFHYKSRLIPMANNRALFTKEIIEELINGPVKENYQRLLTPDTVVQYVALSKSGILYISFNWNIIKALRDNPTKVLYSIAASIKRNIRKVKGIKILVNGIESISTINGIKLSNTFYLDKVIFKIN